MPIGLLAKITVQEGKNEAFEKAFLELTAKVRANEPATYFMHSIAAKPTHNCTL